MIFTSALCFVLALTLISAKHVSKVKTIIIVFISRINNHIHNSIHNNWQWNAFHIPSPFWISSTHFKFMTKSTNTVCKSIVYWVTIPRITKVVCSSTLINYTTYRFFWGRSIFYAGFVDFTMGVIPFLKSLKHSWSYSNRLVIGTSLLEINLISRHIFQSILWYVYVHLGRSWRTRGPDLVGGCSRNGQGRQICP